MSRPVLLALIAAVLAAATSLSARNAHEKSDQSAAPAAPAPAAPAHAAKKPARAHTPKSKRTARKASRSAAAKQAAPARARRPAAKHRDDGMPRGVTRALAQHRTIVLFLNQPGAADDAATATSVASLRGLGRGVAVFTDGIDHIGRYETLVAAVGVSQAPAVVIVGPDRKAHLIEGYVDAETLRQRVADAAR